MRKVPFVVFFSVVLVLYGLLSFYIFAHGWSVVGGTVLAMPYAISFTMLALSFIAGRILERARLSWLSVLLVWTGSLWLAAMVYFLLGVIIVDCIRLAQYFIPGFLGSISGNTAMIIVTGVVTLVVVAGFFNARAPRIRRLDIAIPKKGNQFKTLNLAVVSDIHLGTIICKSRLEKMVSMINRLTPDIVLLPGDVVDEDIGPVIRQNLGETLRTLQSKHGVFAVTGNHEYIGGVEPACTYLQEHGITMLRDSSVKLADSIYIVGREDRSATQFGGRKRAALEELIQGCNKDLPIILMDHQPFNLEESEANGIDLHLSGHTHHGQLWPFNYITKAIYEVSWGYKKKGTTQVYVSSGVGTWGPPVRTGNTPEIVNIVVSFV